MAQTKTITQAVERLGYRVTVGDVAAEAGLPLLEAQQGVLALASDVQAHLQVAESGEIAYVFPKNIEAVLWSKSWRLRWQSAWEKVWRVLFYLIRVSFGVVLILSLVLIVVAITIIAIAASSAGRDDNDSGGGGGGMIFLPRVWLGPDIFWMFDPRSDRRRRPRTKSEMNFLEAVFSFLFGDGNPNADLDERRWQSIAQVIQANGGAVVAEQITPFLGDLGKGWASDLEDFMVPVLSRFNGLPQVSPQGGIVYQFPELQVTAKAQRTINPPPFLRESPRKFSQATSGQIMGAIVLGSANLIGALVLGSMLQDNPSLVAELGGVVALVNSLYWLLLGYGTAFLGLPLVRYFWVQQQNGRIAARNTERERRAEVLSQLTDDQREKLAFAQTLTLQTVVGTDNLAYTTESDLTEQEIAQKDKIDAEWQRLLEERQGK